MTIECPCCSGLGGLSPSSTISIQTGQAPFRATPQSCPFCQGTGEVEESRAREWEAAERLNGWVRPYTYVTSPMPPVQEYRERKEQETALHLALDSEAPDEAPVVLDAYLRALINRVNAETRQSLRRIQALIDNPDAILPVSQDWAVSLIPQTQDRIAEPGTVQAECKEQEKQA